MSFLAPSRLWLLLGVVVLSVAYVVLQRLRRHHAVRFTSLDLLDAVAPRRPGWRRHLAAAAAGLGISALVVGLARPVQAQEVAREEAVVVLVVDTSASMLATDVSPTRLAAATAAAADFVAGVPEGFQVGLVAFDGTARLLAPPTTDHDAVVAALGVLRAGPGTATGDALSVAVSAIDGRLSDPDLAAVDESTAPVATIVLLADGATTVGSPLEGAAAEAAAAGIPVSTIAYGTDAGTVEVEGRTVAVPADEAALAEVAEATGGTAFTAASAEELAQVYDDITARVGTETEDREVDRFFVGVGLAALVAAVVASMVWSGRFL